MNKKILILLFCLLFVGIFYFEVLANQQEKISAYHGADSVFKVKNFESEKEDLSIYYLSLPDTTPEYKTMEKLKNYFVEAEKRLDKIETTVKTE